MDKREAYELLESCKILDGKKIFISISSLSNLYDIVSGLKGSWLNEYSSSEDIEHLTKNFHVTENYDESLDLLKYGYDYGVDELSKHIELDSYGKELKQEYSVSGGIVSVPRFLNGMPSCMIRTTLTNKPYKIINIYKSVSYAWDVSPDEYLYESVKALQIVQTFESQGYRCNLYTQMPGTFTGKKRKHDSLEITVKIKSSDERLNLSSVSYAFLHPDYLRRTMLKLIENITELFRVKVKKAPYGFVCVTDVKREGNNIYLPAHFSINDERIWRG